jgi:hypothetical protein
MQVRLWKVPYAPLEPGPVEAQDAAVYEFQGRHAFRAVDHHWQRRLFATAGTAVEVWAHERSEPVHTFNWGADTVLSVRFNPVRHIILTPRLAVCGGGSSCHHPCELLSPGFWKCCHTWHVEKWPTHLKPSSGNMGREARLHH